MQSRVVARPIRKKLHRGADGMYVECECGERCKIHFEIDAQCGRNLCDCGRVYDHAGWLVALPPADWRERR